MRTGRMAGLCMVVLALLLSGCATNVGQQITTNPRLREQVMGAVAGNGALAQEMTQRLLATDSLRTRVLETVLSDGASAQYVLARIGKNPEAVIMVLQSTAADSAGREYLLTLLKGMQIALKAGGK